MIKVRDLKKQFDGFYALNGVNLNIEKGSVYGLVGPNGAGKSTLIRHLTGIYKQDSGEILIDNEPVYENSEVKSRISYIPDDIYNFMQANIYDMMEFYKGIYKKFDMTRFEKLKDVFSNINIKKPIRKMSKGMQKQAAFWLTICCNPDILILDEPVDGLDPVMRRQIWSLLMQDISERGTTVLVSSHNLRELEDVCDTVGIMNKGKVLIERSLSSLQGNITKLQIAFRDGIIPADFDRSGIIHESKIGTVYNFIIRGTNEEISSKMKIYNPILMDVLPLTLEEIFIYELGGEDYEVKEIIL